MSPAALPCAGRVPPVPDGLTASRETLIRRSTTAGGGPSGRRSTPGRCNSREHAPPSAAPASRTTLEMPCGDWRLGPHRSSFGAQREEKGAPAGGRARRCALKAARQPRSRRAPRPLLRCRPLPSLSEGPRHPLGTTSGQTKSADPPSPPVAPAKNRTRAARRVPVRVRPGNPRTPSPRIARRWHRQVSGHQAPIDPRPARCFTSPEATPSHPHWKCHRARVSSESPAEEGVIIVVCRLDASPTASLRRSAVLSAKRPSVDGYLGHSPMPASRPSPC